MSVYQIIDITPKMDIVCHMYNEGAFILCELIAEEKTMTVGDMLAFRDELIEYGYKLWKDFKIVKTEEDR